MTQANKSVRSVIYCISLTGRDGKGLNLSDDSVSKHENLMAEPEKILLAGSLVLPYDSRSVGAMEPFSGDFIIYQPLGTYAGRTKVRGKSDPKIAPISTFEPHPDIPAVAAFNTVGMLMQELISSTNESKPALASCPSRDSYPNKQSSTRRGCARGEIIYQWLIVSSGSKCLRETLRETTPCKTKDERRLRRSVARHADFRVRTAFGANRGRRALG